MRLVDTTSPAIPNKSQLVFKGCDTGWLYVAPVNMLAKVLILTGPRAGQVVDRDFMLRGNGVVSYVRGTRLVLEI